MVQLHLNMNAPGLKREYVREGVKKALTRNMVFEFWRLSPLETKEGEVIFKDGKRVG